MPACTIALISFHCSSWSTCRTNVQRGGCSFDDILVQVLQYSGWRHFKSYRAIQRYKDAIESLNHLCSNIAPGTNITHSCLRSLYAVARPSVCLSSVCL